MKKRNKNEKKMDSSFHGKSECNTSSGVHLRATKAPSTTRDEGRQSTRTKSTYNLDSYVTGNASVNVQSPSLPICSARRFNKRNIESEL